MLIGIDGGGTKTAMVLANCDGCVIRQSRDLGCNPSDLGIEEVRIRLKTQLDALLRDFGGREAEIESVYAGVAGSGAANTRRMLHDVLSELLPNSKNVDNHTDGFNALYGEAETGEGISLIAGTGSSCFVLSDGEIRQVGGWGYLIDDAGSGYRLGADALKAAYRAYDGRGPQTLLIQKCEAQLGMPLGSAIPTIYKGGKRFVASFSYAALEALHDGDAVAEEIVNNAAEELALHLRVSAKHIHQFPVVTVVCGGLITFEEMMKRVLDALGEEKEKFNIVQPDVAPVYGALVKAAVNAGVKVGKEFRSNFVQSYKE